MALLPSVVRRLVPISQYTIAITLTVTLPVFEDGSCYLVLCERSGIVAIKIYLIFLSDASIINYFMANEWTNIFLQIPLLVFWELHYLFSPLESAKLPVQLDDSSASPTCFNMG